MDELGLFTAALGLSGPWRVVRTEFDVEGTQLDLYLDFERGVDRTRSCRHPVVTAADCQRRKSRGDTPTLHPGIQGPGR